MNKGKLKVLVMALKEIVEELESEVYSDVDAYQNMQVATSKKLDYDEMYDDGSDRCKYHWLASHLMQRKQWLILPEFLIQIIKTIQITQVC